MRKLLGLTLFLSVCSQNSRPLHYLCNHCGIFGVFQHLHFSSWIGISPNQEIQNNHNNFNIVPGIICRTSCMDHGKCALIIIIQAHTFTEHRRTSQSFTNLRLAAHNNSNYMCILYLHLIKANPLLGMINIQ